MANRTLSERMRLHLRSQVDGENAIQMIAYLTYCLATGYELKYNAEVALDDLRTKQITAALNSYHRTLTRVLPDLKAIDLIEELTSGDGSRDFSAMDRLELANRLRHILKNAEAFKQLTAQKELPSDEEFLS